MVPAEPALRFSEDLFPVGGGRLGALIRNHPWSRTQLGPILRWPQSLKTAIDMMMQSPVPMCLLWGADGITVYNDAYVGIAGNRHPAMLGKSIFETWPEVADFNRRVMDAGLAGRAVSFRDQHLVLNRNGRPEDVWLNLDYSPIRDEEGLPAGVLAIVSDTTKQVLAARQLRAREAELARVQRIGKVGGVEVFFENGFQNRRSPEYLTIHGLPPEAAHESHEAWVARIHPDDRVFTEKQFRDAIAGSGRDYNAQYRIIRPSDGETRWISVSAEIERDANGRAVRLVGAHIDITEREIAAAELARLNTTLEQKVEQSTRELDRLWSVSEDMLLVTDKRGVCLSVNPAWTSVLGWSEEDLLGKTSEWLEHPDDIERTRAQVAYLATDGVMPRFENRFRHKDGSYRWISWTAARDDGQVYAVGRDVTAEKKAQEALQTAEEQLRQSQKMEAVGQLTGGIAHDFNNLLTGIIGGLDLVKRRLASGRTNDVDRFIDAAVTSANRAAGLTNRLLAFSRRQALDLKPLDLKHLIVSLEDLLRRTLSEQVDVRIATPDNLWIAEGDANQIETALINLAIDARDAMPDGGLLTIEADNVTVAAGDPQREIAPGDYIVMRVRDNGVGMPSDVQKRAFDPFFTTKPMGQGTGLGLSMVYGYAKQARGHIHLDSLEGEGTIVSLYLPRYLGPAKVASGDGNDAQSPSEETVLVIEDDSAVRLMLIEALQDLGYATIEATDDKGAIPVLESGRRIDLLVTDVGLPGLNGRQIADFARLQRKNLRVLFITGYAEDAAMRDGFLEPGTEILAKPFSIDALTGRLRRITSQQTAPTRH
ncbi:PAS domain S-box protein [Bradyrhizobium prioriisuperbiae]|uniref:PAS domain S-box protein n=1 Tax=Bradyrhizobium prioriisuperbiae TaxID=2854389 RepID=UPI0028E1C5B3|nr:PAS domain S-box protein [Bradyrhizobium prioritasuperba]